MSIVIELKQTLNDNKLSSSEISKVREYLEAIKMHESLIESGLTKKRGNTLAKKDINIVRSVRFNSGL